MIGNQEMSTHTMNILMNILKMHRRKPLVVMAAMAMALTVYASANSAAQSAEKATPPASTVNTSASPSAITPAPNIDPAEMEALIVSVEDSAREASLEIGRLRIAKWKTSADSRESAQNNADSLQRNMTAALPVLTAAARKSPRNMTAAFKLYRNLDALYEVMETLAESAGAFGSKGEYQAIGEQVATFHEYQRRLADYLERLAAAKEAELQSLHDQAEKTPRTPPPPRKKIVIDDEPTKKPSKKR